MVPGGVYLCQVSDSVSCGACCGLYNVEFFSRKALVRFIEKRTHDFDKVPRKVSEIVRFGEMVCQQIHDNQPFPDFHHCPYVGFIGDNFSRVGCLLHPMARGNDGIDFRGLSYYGGMACRIYFCPATRCLPERIKNIVCACFDDWYSYGLIITENNLIASIFHQIETGLGSPLLPSMVSEKTIGEIYNLLTLKLRWPFRSQQWPISNYFFEDRLYQPPLIDYQKIQVKPSRYHSIFIELGSQFPDAQTVYKAERILESHFDAVIDSIISF